MFLSYRLRTDSGLKKDRTTTIVAKVTLEPQSRTQRAMRVPQHRIQTNHSLKRIDGMVGITIPLTLYVPRHSRESVAKAKGISRSVISEGMGHDSEAITHIYLASVDTSVVDKANSLILKRL